MAKGTKRKKAGVSVDFRRVKSKVGKKLPKAQNDTDVTFKSRAINLPGQSLNEDKTGQAVTQRNLTLQELLNQLSHYSERVRKEALTGMQQLFLLHPGELSTQASTVLSKLAECISDTDKAVRAALLELLSTVVLPHMKGAPLGPFLPLIMAHLSRALTSLTEAVRSDALDFLEAFMGAAPREALQAYLHTALHHFAELLSPTRRSSTVSAKSAASMLKVIQALQRVLSKALAATPASASPAAAKLKPQTHIQHGRSAEQAQQHSLFQGRCSWPPGNAADLSHLQRLSASAEQALTAMPAQAHGKTTHQEQPLVQQSRSLGQLLLEQLLSCWTECAPGQLATGPELTGVQCMEAILHCLVSLLHDHPTLLPQGVPRSNIVNILKKVTPHVPAAAPAVKPSQQMQQALVQLNLASAKLLGSFLPFTRPPSDQDEEEGWRDRLQEYYIGVMEHGKVLPSRQALAEDVQQASLPVDICTAVLQGVQAVLPFTAPQRRAALLSAVTSLTSRSKPRSPVKGACLAFQQGLLAQKGAGLFPEPLIGVPLLPKGVVIDWVQALPRLLWELGASKPQTSKTALQMVHDVSRVAPRGSVLSAALDKLQLQLCPLWGSLLDPKGAPKQGPPADPKGAVKQGLQTKRGSAQGSAEGGKVFVPGPLAQLPLECQELAADLLFFYPTIAEATARTCALVCLTDTYPEKLAIRIIDVIAARPTPTADSSSAGQLPAVSQSTQHAGAAEQAGQHGVSDMPNVLSMLVSIMLGKVTKASLSVGASRHEALVGAVCRAMHSIGHSGRVLEGMAPVLRQECEAGLNALALKGLFTVLTSVALSHPEPPPPWQGSTPPDPASQQQHDWDKRRPRYYFDFACCVWMSATDKEGLTSYTMQSYPPDAWQQALDPGTAADDNRAQAEASVRLKPVVDLIVACPKLHLIREYARIMSDQLLPVGEPGPAEQAILEDNNLSEVAYTPPRGPAGPNVVHAVLDALLVISQHEALLPAVLRWQGMVLRAVKTVRTAVRNLGSLSPAGASAVRKCDLLVTVLTGLYGSTARMYSNSGPALTQPFPP